MTLDKAINCLKDELTREVFYYGPERKEALQIGIEALKRVRAHRASSLQSPHILLQGETKD